MSTTTNLKLFKHDNPTTSEEQFDVEKALNANWDKLDTNAGETAKKIKTLEDTTNEKDTSQNAEIQLLKVENALLKSQIPSATVVKASVHLEDSSNMPCEIMPLGVSKQERTPSIESESPIECVGDNINLIDARYGIDITSNDVYTIEVKPNTSYSLYLSQKCISLGGTTSAQHQIKYLDSNGNILTQSSICFISFTEVGEIVSNSKTFTTPENCTKLNLDIGTYWNTGNTSTIQNIEVKLTKGASTGVYSPYGQGSIGITIGDGITSEIKALYTKKPLRSIGDIKDRFAKVDGVWYEEHKIERYIFTGNENFKLHGSIPSWFYADNVILNSYYNNTANDYMISNYFIQYPYNQVSGIPNNNLALGILTGTSKRIVFKNTNFTTANEFKTWVTELYDAGTPLYVDYLLEVPELIPCTAEQVEVLDGFNTYKNITNITSDSIGELEVFYYKDIETLSKNNEDRILALENAIL